MDSNTRLRTPEYPKKGLFITATDTGIGKTWTTVAIARALQKQNYRVGAYKPVATGVTTTSRNLRDDDAFQLWDAIGRSHPIERVCPQIFNAPVAPPVAAREENMVINRELLFKGAAYWNQLCDILLVEGVGGLLCPLTETESVADLAKGLGYPLIIVIGNHLGTINHTLLTIEVAEKRGLSIAGLVINSTSPESESSASKTNPDELKQRVQYPILATVGYQLNSIRNTHEKPTGPHLFDHPFDDINWLTLTD